MVCNTKSLESDGLQPKVAWVWWSVTQNRWSLTVCNPNSLGCLGKYRLPHKLISKGRHLMRLTKERHSDGMAALSYSVSRNRMKIAVSSPASANIPKRQTRSSPSSPEIYFKYSSALKASPPLYYEHGGGGGHRPLPQANQILCNLVVASFVAIIHCLVCATFNCCMFTFAILMFYVI